MTAFEKTTPTKVVSTEFDTTVTETMKQRHKLMEWFENADIQNQAAAIATYSGILNDMLTIYQEKMNKHE